MKKLNVIFKFNNKFSGCENNIKEIIEKSFHKNNENNILTNEKVKIENELSNNKIKFNLSKLSNSEAIKLKIEILEEKADLMEKTFIERQLNHIIIVNNKLYKKNILLKTKNNIIINSKVIFLDNANINIESLFKDCNKIKSISGIFKINPINIKSIKQMFCGCSSLESLSGLKFFDTYNVEDMSNLFCDCKKLKYLPDISKFNTNKLKKFYSMFKNCESLEYIPDISKWNTINIKNMDSMFKNCELLEYIPDISKWNTINIKSMDSLFYKCKSLKSLPHFYMECFKCGKYE